MQPATGVINNICTNELKKFSAKHCSAKGCPFYLPDSGTNVYS